MTESKPNEQAGTFSKLAQANRKVTKSKEFSVVFVVMILLLLASGGYLYYTEYFHQDEQNTAVTNQVQEEDNKELASELYDVFKSAKENPHAAIQKLKQYQDLSPLLNNRKLYVESLIYEDIKEPALAFIKIYEVDQNYLGKYSSLRRAELAKKIGLESIVVDEYSYLSEKYSNDPKIQYELAKSYLRQGLKDEAKKKFEEIQTNFLGSDYAIGSEYYLAGLAGSQEERFTKLTSYLKQSPQGSLSYLVSNELLNNFNGNSLEVKQLYNHIALSYYHQGNYNKALEYFNPDLITKPEFFIEEYIRALVHKNKLNKALQVIVEYLPRVNDKDKAINVIDYLVKFASKYSTVNTLRQLESKVLANIKDKVLWELAKKTRSKEDYRKVYSQFPDSLYAAESMARVFWMEYQRDNFHGALELYKKHWAKYNYANSHSFVAFWAGKIYLKQGEEKNAKETWSKLVTAHPRDYYSYRVQQMANNVSDWYLMPSANKFVGFPNWNWPEVYKDSEITDKYGSDVLELTKIAQHNFILKLAENKEINLDKKFKMWLLTQSGNYFKAISTAYFAINRDSKPESSNINFAYAFPLAYADIITDIASKNLKVDPMLVHALIRQESHYQRDIVSKVGAIGLMQLMPYTAKALARSENLRPPRPYDLMQPETNIKLGIRYMEQVFGQFENNMIHAIASYNAGPQAIKRWIKKYQDLEADEFIEKIPYRETKDYVKKVLNNYWVYKNLYT